VPPALYGTSLLLWGIGIGRSGKLEKSSVIPFDL